MIVLIPSLEPDARLVELVRDLRGQEPRAGVLVVDDGSGPAFDAAFDQVEAAGATVLRLPVNHGKGHALKLGLRYVATEHPGQDVVSADCDGQHTVADIGAVAAALSAADDALVLGVREFTGEVPWRSRFGNAFSRAAFALATRLRLTDTQTGLRGYPAGLLGWADAVPGDRFDYEQRVLLAATCDGVRVREVPVSTVYLEANRSSHFRPVLDSIRVLAPVARFLASSFLGFCLDTVALLVLFAATGSLLGSVLGARGLSGAVNFMVNRRWVFGDRRRSARTAAVQYAVLAGVLLAANFGMLTAFVGFGLPVLLAKVVTEMLLLGASFTLQRRVVFAERVPAPATGPTGRVPVPG